MNANNITQTPKATVHNYEVVKYNKHSTIYQSCDILQPTRFVTPLVRVEVFQKYSKAHNLGLYFRIKNTSNWTTSKLITGLFKTSRLNHFYGDYKSKEGKSLLLFKLDEVGEQMTVYEYPKGYYPSSKVIHSLISQL